MKRILTLAAALTLITTLTGCGSGAQSESALDTTSQTATEVDDDNATQKIDPFEGVVIRPNFAYPDFIDFILDTDASPYYNGYTSLVYSGILSADTKGMTIELSLDMESSQSFLSENNYEVSIEKKTYELPINQMYASLISKEQLESCKADLLKKAEIDVDSYIGLFSDEAEIKTYQLKNSIALLLPDNTTFAENLVLKRDLGQLYSNVSITTPNPNIIFCFESSNGMSFVAQCKACLKEGSFSDYLNNDKTVFLVTGYDSYDEAINHVNATISACERRCSIDNSALDFEKVEFSVE